MKNALFIENFTDCLFWRQWLIISLSIFIITYLRKCVKSVSCRFLLYSGTLLFHVRITQSHRSRWKKACDFRQRKRGRAAVKIHDNDVWEPVLSHAILKNRNAYDVRITRGNTSSYSNRRFCVEKRLTKPRVCGIIFPASERGSPRSIFYLGV